MLEFGKKIQDKKYTHRLCSYAVLINEAGKVGLVKNQKGYYLVGGGIEKDETAKEALHREALEEIGMSIKITKKIGNAIDYCDGAIYRKMNKYWSKKGHFFQAETIEFIQEPIELDHQLLWLTKEEAIKSLFYQSHQWAVMQSF